MENPAQRSASLTAAANRAIASSLWQQPVIAQAGAWISVCVGTGFVWIALQLRDVPPLAVWLPSIVVVILTLLALALHFVGRRLFYRLVVTWISLVQVTITAQLLSLHFGPEKALVREGMVPLLGVAAPVLLVGARAYLAQEHARLLNGGFIGALMLISGLYALQNWDQATTPYAIIVMLIIAFLLAPLTELLLAQHLRVQSAAAAALAAQATELEIRAREAEARERTDELTGLYNRRGTLQSLGASLAQAPRVGVARLCLCGEEALAAQLEPKDWDQLRQDLARLLRDSLGEDYALGRVKASQLVVWSAREDAVAGWAEDMADLRERLQREFAAQGQDCTLGLGASVWERGAEAARALEDTSFRCYMDCLDRGERGPRR